MHEQRRLIMTCEKPIEHKIKNVFGNWLNVFSIERKLTNDQMESMQFGIYDYSDRKVKEIPFLHY